MRDSFKLQVYKLVKKIPKGKVMTYGQIAQKLGRPKAAKTVGNILHQNSSLRVPCHRVVNKEGRIALRFVFGGAKEQKRRLLLEGIKFKDKMHVDIRNG